MSQFLAKRQHGCLWFIFQEPPFLISSSYAEASVAVFSSWARQSLTNTGDSNTTRFHSSLHLSPFLYMNKFLFLLWFKTISTLPPEFHLTVSCLFGSLLWSSSNPMMLGCIAASALLRKAASVAFSNKKRATLTTDIIEHLGERLSVHFNFYVTIMLNT